MLKLVCILESLGRRLYFEAQKQKFCFLFIVYNFYKYIITMSISYIFIFLDIITAIIETIVKPDHQLLYLCIHIYIFIVT